MSEAADELPDTIRSRCQRIELGVVADATIQAALVDAGTDADEARLAARLSGGQLGRARELAGDTRALRDAFVDAAPRRSTAPAPQRGKPRRACSTRCTQAIAAVKQHHADELAVLRRGSRQQAGYEARDVRRFRRRIEERQPARERLARRKALGEGIAALESLYRDSLAGADAPRPQPRPRAGSGTSRARGPRAGRAAARPATRSSSTPTRACCSNDSCCISPGRPAHPLGRLAAPRRDSSVGRAAHS